MRKMKMNRRDGAMAPSVVCWHFGFPSGQELVECASRAGLLDDCCSPDPALPRLVHMMLMGRGDKVAFGLRAGGEPGWRRDQSASAQRPSGFDWGATKVAWEIRRGALPEGTAHK